MNEELLMEVVRMLREREDYFEKEWLKAGAAGLSPSAAIMLGKTSAYNSARQMLMAALTGDVEILHGYDYFGQDSLDK